MSELRVDNIVDMGGSGAPQLRKGASVTGISTITQAVVGNATINAGGINATGVVTSTSNKFVGDFASGNITAGVMTATSSVVASNITINSGGVNASGIVSATSYQGSGANLTGIGLSIAPLAYNPDVFDMKVSEGTGIGLTFNQRVSAGTGNVTLSLVSVGSTLVENFSVGSSVTYNNDADPPNITINPTSDLSQNTVYAISYPSGAFTQTGTGGSFVGTAYTFKTILQEYTIWSWGDNTYGQLGLNDVAKRSSPTQIPGITWEGIGNFNGNGSGSYQMITRKSDGTLWSWGYNTYGALGHNNRTHYSSPVQIPGTTWSSAIGWQGTSSRAIKTDGTMWVWGNNAGGHLGLNGPQVGDNHGRSSPTQIPGTTWSTGAGKNAMASSGSNYAIKTDGTLWAWGYNFQGALGLNAPTNTHQSSPTQVGSDTTWNTIATDGTGCAATKTDGTAWAWGYNEYGQLGQNQGEGQLPRISSPVQIGSDTTWTNINTGGNKRYGFKTDGTMWAWGQQAYLLSPQSPDHLSSPVQIPGTTWKAFGYAYIQDNAGLFTKTDGTLWGWGFNGNHGQLGQNNLTNYDSPVQIPGTTWNNVKVGRHNVLAQRLLEE